ncbi:MAG TPA: HAD family hydrolase [Terracidiphilus sp.]|nr:HAD family hydrolase [Terracidiphilus sp.]
MPPPAQLLSPLKLSTVFLDRDGVINEKMPEGSYVRSLGELRLLPGAAEAIAKLNRVHLRTLVVTNQRGVALGLYSMADVEAIHSALQRQLAGRGAHVDRFYVCPHDKGRCNCRKPLPGLYEQALADFPDIDAAASVLIGDSLSDIEFGRRLGMHTVFIGDAPGRPGPGAETAGTLADLRLGSLAEAVDKLLETNR